FFARLKNDPKRGCGRCSSLHTVAPVEVTMRLIRSAIVLSVLIVAGTAALVAQSPSHNLQSDAEAKWGPAPPMLPAGAQIAVLSGDPGKSAPFAVRLKFPANYA